MSAHPYVSVWSPQDPRPWLEVRAELHREGYVGASVVATIMGENPYQSPLDAYLEAVGERPAFAGNEATRRGQRFESVIIAHADAEGILPGVAPWGELLRSRHLPLAATPDARAGDLLVQVKDTRQVWEDEPPLMYQIQVQAELAVTGLEEGALLAYDGAKELRVWRYPRHEGAQQAVAAAAEDFVRRIRELDPPPLAPTAANLGALKRAYPHATEREITLPSEAVEKDARRLALLAEINVRRRELDELEAWFRHEMQDAQRAVLPGGGAYQLKTEHRKGYTVEPSTVRVLRRVKR